MNTDTRWCPNCAGVLNLAIEPAAAQGQVAYCSACGGRFNLGDARLQYPPDDFRFRCRFCRALNLWERGNAGPGAPAPQLVCWRCGQLQPSELAWIPPGSPGRGQAPDQPANFTQSTSVPAPAKAQQPAQAPEPEWEAPAEEKPGPSIGRYLVASLASLLLLLVSLTAGMALAYALLQGGYFPLKSAYESSLYWPQLFSLPFLFGLFTAAFILPGLWRRITRAPSRGGCAAYALMLLRGVTVGLVILLVVFFIAGRGLVSQQAFDRFLLDQEKPGQPLEAPTSLPGGESFAPEQILPAAPALDSATAAPLADQAPARPTPVESGGGGQLVPTQGALPAAPVGALPSAPTQAPAGAASGGRTAPSPLPARSTSLPTSGVPGSQPRAATSPPPARPTTEPPASQPQGGPVAHDDYSESSGCPQGMRCITQGSFAWPTESASYCIAPASGLQLAGKLAWGDAAIDGYMVDSARYWQTALGFSLVKQATCTTATNIIVGWANVGDPTHLGETYVNYLVKDQQVVILLNTAFNWNPAAGGYHGSLTMAHEIGHAIGLGHDADPRSMMYVYGNPGANFSTPCPVGQDTINQYAVKYNPRPRLNTQGYERYGFSGEYLTSENGATVVKQIPIPSGMSDRLQDLRAACTVTSYRPNGDPDFSFKCVYDFASAARGYVTFTLYATESDKSSVSVYGMVWDANVFPIVGWTQFGMSSDKIWIRNDPNAANAEYPLPYKSPIWVPVDASGNIRGTYLITIHTYQSHGSDYFGWEVRDPWDGWLTFRTFGGVGNQSEFVGGEIFILAWSGPGAMYPNLYGLNTQIDVRNRSYTGIVDPRESEPEDTGMKIWASNASAFSSLIGYYPYQSRAYQAESVTRAEASTPAPPGSPHATNVGLFTEVDTWNGSQYSWATFQNVLIQIWK